MANIKYKQNGEYKDIVVKVGDTLPIGAEVDYEGSSVPDGWEEITDTSIFTPYTSWTRNTTYVSQTGYMNCYKNDKICSFNANFKIDPAPTDKGIILIENLPQPKNRITTCAVIEEGTTVRLYIDTNGKLYTDSRNYTTGWLSFNVMYVLA